MDGAIDVVGHIHDTQPEEMNTVDTSRYGINTIDRMNQRERVRYACRE